MAKTPEEICEKQLVSSQFEWRIPRFKSVLQQNKDVSMSPPHAFCEGNWTFGFTKIRDLAVLNIERLPTPHYHENYLEWKLIIIENEDTEYLLSKRNWTVPKEKSRYYYIYDAERFSLTGERGEFDLKLICLLKCFHCKPPPQTVLSKSFDSLAKDLMDLFVSGEDADLKIKVKDREFRVHKCIIRSRAPVFFSMFSHGMLESNSGRVDIEDCDAEAFQTFLQCIYSGKLNCSQDVVRDIYYITDKYQVSDIKAECAKFMSQNLSVENFCDTVRLSLLHVEIALLESAHQFFAQNSKSIIRTAPWLSFLKEEPVAANDFFIRLLDREDSLFTTKIK